MGLLKFPWLVLLCWLLSLFCFGTLSDDSELSVKFLKAPLAFSHLKTAAFVFQVFVGGNESTCTNCRISCKLDGGTASDCRTRKVLYEDLKDGDHAFDVCISGSGGNSYSTYNWIVDTIPPTAYINASQSFTNSLNVSVNVSFTEPCPGGGGFGCSSVNACNLLVYGPGQVIPSSLTTLQPNLTYSLLVALSPTVQYGRVILVMGKYFCTDPSGNRFMRGENSSVFVHFDRRNVLVDVRPHIPEKLLQLNNETRTVRATNNHDNLKVYLYFSEPVRNSSKEILNSLSTTQGTLLPISGESLGNRRFGFQLVNISSMAIISINIHSNSILSRAGTPVSPISPVTFLYDLQRPAVRLSTTSNARTREHNIPVLIKFMKPVFGFNSSLLSITGGHLSSFHEVSRSNYIAQIQADGDIISIHVPQNVTEDVAGNKNLASKVLQVRHYSVPLLSCTVFVFVTACFLATTVAAGLLTVSTASLQNVGAFSRPSSLLTSDPTRIIFRSACYIQVFALSRWLAVTLPIEYYELARHLQWSVPYFPLPWETGGLHSIMVVSNSSLSGPHSPILKIHDLGASQNMQIEGEDVSIAASSVYGLPLTAMEYREFFESQNAIPEAENITHSHHASGWRDFERSMFWLATLGGSLILLHALLLLILRLCKKNSEKQSGYGALIFPRFEIFLMILALPCICKASASLVRGRNPAGIGIGSLLQCFMGLLLLALLLFLFIGIMHGKLLQYKEVHQIGQKFHWYQEFIRVTLGPGKRGQWTWKNQPNSIYITMFGPLFEDLRGPPKYMLSQISGSNPTRQEDHIIASADETEDAEAPFIQKLFGILRIYYTLLDLIKRVTLGILAGAFLDNWSSKAPTIILLCITGFQLFFILLKKPFIKKKVQLVEIISLSCQLGIFACCFALLEKEFSMRVETSVGIFMVILFLIGLLVNMINEWYALYRQIKQLDPAEKSFLTGLKTASIGFLLFFIPQKMCKNLESKLPRDRGTGGETGSSAERCRNPGMTDKPWLKQLRELAMDSFTKEGSGAPTDPSSSRTK